MNRKQQLLYIIADAIDGGIDNLAILNKHSNYNSNNIIIYYKDDYGTLIQKVHDSYNDNLESDNDIILSAVAFDTGIYYDEIVQGLLDNSFIEG